MKTIYSLASIMGRICIGYSAALIICWMWIFNFRLKSLTAEIIEGVLPLIISCIVASIILTIAELLGKRNPCKTKASQCFVGAICFAVSFMGLYLTTDSIWNQIKILSAGIAIATSAWVIISLIWKTMTHYVYKVFFD